MIAGPSGVGKGSVVKTLLARDPDGLRLSVSATTRRPRPGETPGADYVFVDDTEFSRMVEAGELLEWAEVFGNRYGTPRAYVDAQLDAGHDVVLEIDVQGAQQVRSQAPDALLILLEPPTRDDLASRLRGRGTESEERIAARLDKADWELAQRGWFDQVVVNDDLEHASSQVAAIIDGSRAEPSADGHDPTEDRSG